VSSLKPSPTDAECSFRKVNGSISRAKVFTVTRNEILYSLNKPEDFVLAIVEFLDDDLHRVHYIRQPFGREPNFGAASVNYDLKKLIERSITPN
jgi:Domain of unknown function (DUF3883)